MTPYRSFVPERPLEDVRRYAPWAKRIVKVQGGWLVFASEGDFRTWRHHQQRSATVRP